MVLISADVSALHAFPSPGRYSICSSSKDRAWPIALMHEPSDVLNTGNVLTLANAATGKFGNTWVDRMWFTALLPEGLYSI